MLKEEATLLEKKVQDCYGWKLQRSADLKVNVCCHDTRYRDFFKFIGDFSSHYGIFPGCGTVMPCRDGSEEPATTYVCC